MEPYGQDQQEAKGLFTFYRQQDQLEQDLKLKLKSQNLNQILNKFTKPKYHQSHHKNQHPIIKKQKTPQSQRPSYKLNLIAQEHSLPLTKRNQSKITKPSFKIQHDHLQIQQQHINPPQNRVFYEINTGRSEIQRRYQKYLSELETIRGSKVRKRKAVHQQKRASSQIYDQYHQNKSDIGDTENNNKLSLQLRKLAIEPHEFGLQQLSKNFVAVALYKKEKAGLKSYRREKQKAQTEFRRDDGWESPLESEKKNKMSVLQSLLKVREIKNKESKQLEVNASGLSAREEKLRKNKKNKNNKKNSIIINNQNSNGDELRSSSLPRLKMMMNSPQMEITKKSNVNMLPMSLQIQKINQLRSKYQIRNIQKQDVGMIKMNGKIRMQMKTRNQSSRDQLRQHLQMVMKMNEDDQNNIYSPQIMMQSNHLHNNNDIYSNNSIDKIQKITTMQKNTNAKQRFQQHQSKQETIKNNICSNNEQIFQNRHKQIFCKRDSYLKNYKSKLKTNIFQMEKSQQTQLKSFMEGKKKQIMENLFGKFSLL